MSAWPQPFLIAYLFAVGSVVGSFLNVVIYRVPLGRSVVSPRSACPACNALIRWYDNIPIVSWLLLGARCRSCGIRISLRYPTVEAVAGLMAVLSVQRYGLSVAGAEVLVFGWITMALGLIDFDHQLLPDVLTYPSILLGLTAANFGGLTTLLDALLGAFVGAALPTVVIVLYKLIRGEEGMGWGDVKYLAAIGAVVGLRPCLWVLVAAAVVGAGVGVVLIIAGRGSSRTALPFGSFLAVAVLAWLYLPASWLSWSVL